MKVIKETKLVEQTTEKFIAEDGKEFKTERDCISYEKGQNKNRLEKEFLCLVTKNLSCNLFERVQYTTRMYKVKMNDYKDYLLVNAYANNFSDIGQDLEEPKTFPCEKYFMISECWSCWYNFDLVKEIKTLAERLENEEKGEFIYADRTED